MLIVPGQLESLVKKFQWSLSSYGHMPPTIAIIFPNSNLNLFSAPERSRPPPKTERLGVRVLYHWRIAVSEKAEECPILRRVLSHSKSATGSRAMTPHHLSPGCGEDHEGI